MKVYEAQHVELTNWSDDCGLAPRLIRTALYDNEAAAKAALNDWSGGLTTNRPTIEGSTEFFAGWAVKREEQLFGFAIITREVQCEHSARKTGQSARHKKKEKDESVNPEQDPAQHGAGVLASPSSDIHTGE